MRRSSLINSIAAVGVSLTMAGCSSSPMQAIAIPERAANDLTQSSKTQAITMQDVHLGVLPKQARYEDPIKAGGTALRLIGADEFCTTNKKECGEQSQYHTRAQYKKVSSDTWQTIHHFSRTNIDPVTDKEHYARDELWAYPTDMAGDCEDYQIYNRTELFNKHAVHPNDTRMIVVVKHDGEGHLVQAVNTQDKGWMVSDNLQSDIYPLQEAFTRYAKVSKMTSNLWNWVDVKRAKTPAEPKVAAYSPQ